MPPEQKDDWITRFEKEFSTYIYLAIGGVDSEKIKSFIASEIQKAREESYPYDISAWRNVGEKRGYFKFFCKKCKKVDKTK
jgi:hypothetical protein